MPSAYDTRRAFERDFPNVKGTAIAGNGSLLVLVTRKYDESELAPEEIVPPHVVIDGQAYETDVVPVGIPHLTSSGASAGTTPDEHRERHRPIPGGVSLGNASIGAGTMGSPLLRTEADDPVVLTNAHISSGEIDHYQPSSLDGGAHETPVATIHEESPLESGPTLTTDSALLDVDPDGVTNEILGIGRLVGVASARRSPSAEYHKSGRTTGVTTGDLRGVDAEIDVAYGPDTLRFGGVDVFDDMSAPGDSGSLIGYYEGDGRNEGQGEGAFIATSLLFAGSDRITLGIPFAQVEEYHGTLTIPEPGGGEDDDMNDGTGDTDDSDRDTDTDTDTGNAGDLPSPWGDFRRSATLDPDEDVVDGDTMDFSVVHLGAGTYQHGETIRLLEIDTAELPPYLNFPNIDIDDIREDYPEAVRQYEFARQWYETGIEEYEGDEFSEDLPFVLETYQDEYDAFGRLLTHVIRKSDNASLADALREEFGDDVHYELEEQLERLRR